MRKNPQQRRTRARQQCQTAALKAFLMRLPVDLLEDKQRVVDIMSRHTGKHLDYQLLLQVRDELQRTA